MALWDSEIAVGQQPPEELYLYLQQQPDGEWTIPRVHEDNRTFHNMVATRETLPRLHKEMRRLRLKFPTRKDSFRLFKFGHSTPIDYIDESRLVASVEKQEEREARASRRRVA